MTTGPPSTASSGSSTPAANGANCPSGTASGSRSTTGSTRWRADGTVDRILERLHPKLDERGRIDHDLWCVDATSIRASRAAAGAGGEKVEDEPVDHALGRSRGGFGTKLHPVVDGHGLPLSAVVTAGPGPRVQVVGAGAGGGAAETPGRGRPRRRPRRLAGDKGYSYRRIRRYLRRRGIKAVIPTRKDQRRNPRFDKEAYRRPQRGGAVRRRG